MQRNVTICQILHRSTIYVKNQHLNKNVWIVKFSIMWCAVAGSAFVECTRDTKKHAVKSLLQNLHVVFVCMASLVSIVFWIVDIDKINRSKKKISYLAGNDGSD